MFKIKNKMFPLPVNDIFKDSISHYDLRHKRVWDTCKVKTVYYGTETIRYRGPITWNILPQDIKDSQTLNIFKNKIKSWSPNGCTCRLCKTFIPELGFID